MKKGYLIAEINLKFDQKGNIKNDFTRILNIGCALPEGHIENYAKHSLTGWTYQIVEIDIWDNNIMEVQNISMKKLKELIKKSEGKHGTRLITHDR